MRSSGKYSCIVTKQVNDTFWPVQIKALASDESVYSQPLTGQEMVNEFIAGIYNIPKERVSKSVITDQFTENIYLVVIIVVHVLA